MNETGDMTSHYLVDVLEAVAEERGWSMREIARRSGLPYATVQKIASRSTNPTVPKRETLEALAYGMSVPVATLLDAAAKDSGFTTQTATSGDHATQVVIAAMEELSEQRRAEIAALALAMLNSQRSALPEH